MKCNIIACMAIFYSCLFSISISHSDVILEPFTYHQDFETNELSAWASYPLWQDTAYDPNMRVHTIIPGDPNLSIVQKITPYTSVDNYAGTQKKLDIYMVPGSTVSLRYYLKTNLPAEFFEVRFAAGTDGKVDFTIADPPTNRWEWITFGFTDIIRENSNLAGRDRIKVNAIAVLAKIPNADPAMSIYLGVDDVTFKGARVVQFQFAEPEMYKLSEWKPYIIKEHFYRGDSFNLRGTLPIEIDRVTLTVVPFTDRATAVLTKNMKKRGEELSAQFKISYPEGLYLATISAYRGGEIISDTEFTFYIAPKNIGGSHPRLWFDSEKKSWIVDRLESKRFKKVAENIVSRAKTQRENHPLESIEYDVDQFWGGDISATWGSNITPWFSRINSWRNGIYYSALAYGLLGDREAGEYGRALLVKLSTFPQWVHPSWKDRGRHIYYPIGELGMDMALGYDLLYDLFDVRERKLVQSALRKQIIMGCHRGYVEDNLVTNNTSNWVAHITGGSLMCQAVIYGDDPDFEPVEPFFTGVMFKTYDFIQKAFGRYGSYGEGYGYYNFTMLSLSKSLPAVDNVFHIDLSKPIRGTYSELIRAGSVKEKQYFYFGDSGGSLRSLTNCAWLLAKYNDPLLGWFYNHLKSGETFMDVLYETGDVPRKDPFDENPVRVFRDVGTTVFKSGWEPDDFIFVMRTGPFFNHQHLDQGSFWLSDRGSIFIKERQGSTYYDDPLYQPWYTQPVAHSTILIDGNHQSQRTGDPLRFAGGFHDHAFISHFLDGENTAFSSGNIDRVYWGKVKELKRNVLYLKPRTVLMLDAIVPDKRDVDVTLLYQTERLNDIAAGEDISTIGNTLNIYHLYPEHIKVASVETPHYLYTLRNNNPLEKEGMLTVSARTKGAPLVMANMITMSDGKKPDTVFEYGDGFVKGSTDGDAFAFSTRHGIMYDLGTIQTDALAISYCEKAEVPKEQIKRESLPEKGVVPLPVMEISMKMFVAECTMLYTQGRLNIKSDEPITFERSLFGNMKYYLADKSTVLLGTALKPTVLIINGKDLKKFTYDNEQKTVSVVLPGGEGFVEINY